MTRLFRILATAVLPLATIASAATPARRAPAHAAPAMRDWSQVANRTPEGNYVLGNPAAKVKLVEMLSFTCPHCALFEAEAVPKLIAKYVRTGKVSYEVRVALRDPFDLAAAVLARCDGPARFFQMTPILFAAQEKWAMKGEQWSQTAPDLSKMDEGAAARTIMQGAGLDKIVAAHGITVAHAAQCVSNVPDQKFLSAQAQKIWATPGFPGTPGFMINGALRNDIHDWAGLDGALGPLL